MKCPFCVSEMDDAALVCKICQRDVYLYKPLLERIEKLEIELSSVKEKDYSIIISGLETTIDQLRLKATSEDRPKTGLMWMDALAYAMLLLMPLLLSHIFLVLLFDLHLVFLRLVCIALPLSFGFYLGTVKNIKLQVFIALGTFVAVCSVFAMSSLTALVDKTPIFPQNLFEVREFLEFSLSIFLGFMSGITFANVLQQRNFINDSTIKAQNFPKSLRSKAAASSKYVENIQGMMKKIEEFGGSAIGVCTTLLSIYTGLKNVI